MSRTTGWDPSVGEQLTEDLKRINDLRDQYTSGKISQSSYINSANSLSSTIQKALQYFSTYSGPAWNWAMGQGGQKFLDTFAPEIDLMKRGQQMVGRELSANEVAQFLPYFQGPNGSSTGPAALAQFAEADKLNPATLAKKSGQYSDQIGGFYQDLLKRGATKEEADYFGRLMASGQVSPYEIQQFIKATPEYQGNQDKEFRSSLSDELAGYDEKAFARERDNIMSQYTRAGLQNSSALDYAITDALSKIQENRGSFLGQLSASQYGGNKEAAREDYRGYLNRYLDDRNYTRGRRDSSLDYFMNRANEGVDYERQRNDYLTFLANQPQRKGNMGSALGPLIGAGIGAIGAGMMTGGMGAGEGAMLGARLGGAGGGAYDYLNY